jgi:tetratricopeptide (TPR) repeat protein
MMFVFFGPVLWWLWWLLLTLTITGLSFINSNIITDKEWKVEETPQYSLSFSFVLIVVMAVIIMGGVWGVKIYIGERAYAEALNSNNIDTIELKLKEAITQRSKVDSYYVGLARVYLLRAAQVIQTENPNMEQVSTLVAEAVDQSRNATNLSPNSVALWENLATMYENASMIIPEARQWSIDSWTKASLLEPTNPVLYANLGNNYLASDDKEKAIENYQKAIDLKSDYALGYIGLANAYEKDDNLSEAIETYKKILSVGTDNVDVFYNFGRLLYNRNTSDDRKQAEDLWLKLVEAQPKYSNALYSLGLLYEARNEKSKALSYYYKVRELNPNNVDILNKIKSMVGEPQVENVADEE